MTNGTVLPTGQYYQRDSITNGAVLPKGQYYQRGSYLFEYNNCPLAYNSLGVLLLNHILLGNIHDTSTRAWLVLIQHCLHKQQSAKPNLYIIILAGDVEAISIWRVIGFVSNDRVLIF